MKGIFKLIFLLIVAVSMTTQQSNAQALNKKQKSIVAISALSAKGNLPALEKALNTGLDDGLTVNEIKEILIQIAAYCGFPRSLNAINTFEAVEKHRKAKGINDPIGTEPTILPVTANKYEIGKHNLEKLTGRPETGAKPAYAVFVPTIEVFLKEHLFADIFSRGVLTNQERELVTVSALSAIGGVASQLQAHLTISMHVGLTENQLKEMLDIIRTDIGKKEADEGAEVLAKVVAAKY